MKCNIIIGISISVCNFRTSPAGMCRLCTATSMAVESEAIGLRNIRELGDDAKDFVKSDFVLVVYFIPPSFRLTKNSKSLSRIDVSSLI